MKTTSYKISKQLKEAGFEAEFNFHYKATDHCNLYDSGYEDYKDRNTPAYDLETILDALPNTTEIIISSLTGKRIFYLDSNIRGNEVSIEIEENESLADTAGRMWLELKEKNLL